MNFFLRSRIVPIFAVTLVALAAFGGDAPPSGAGASPRHPLLEGKVAPPKADEPLRLVHMTDTHVVADGTVLTNADTAANLRVAIALVNAMKPRPHLVAVTGDFTLDSATGLWFFKSLMARLEVPWFPVPGNHDKALKRKVCEDLFVSLGFPLRYSFDYAGRHFVAVDAQDSEKDNVRGTVSQAQLEWLWKDLDDHAGMETLLFVHQHPLLNDWTSPNTFAENAPLLRVIRSFPGVRWVFNGHSHDNRFIEFEGTRYVTTAATAYTFGPTKLPFPVHGSGLRLLEFGPKGVSSKFLSLSGEAFVDPAPERYLSAFPDPAGWVKAFGRDTPAFRAPPARRPCVQAAICQVPHRSGALEENLKSLDGALREAKRKGAKIACFPEIMAAGLEDPKALEAAQPIPGPFSDRMAALAREHGLFISAGLTEKTPGGIHISAVLFGPDGSLLLVQRMVTTPQGLSSPGLLRGSKEEIRAAATPLGRIGLLAGTDLLESSCLEALKALKPDLVIVPAVSLPMGGSPPIRDGSLRDSVLRAALRLEAPVLGPSMAAEAAAAQAKGAASGAESAAADGDGNLLFFGLTGRSQTTVFPVPLGKAERKSF